MKSYRPLPTPFLVLLVTGCAHYPVNAPLQTFDSNQGYRFQNLLSSKNSDEVFVVLTFSGGGTRAAALAYGVLQQLRNTHIHVQEKTRTLLDEVDVISSVSGGSFTAAYYALHGHEIFASFETKFLKKDIESALVGEVFWNLLRLMSPTFSRIDLAAEYHDKHIFDHNTFSDLTERGTRPFLIINAADMTLGSPFEFTQDQFDLLYSDLGSVSIARAVAASSAFPVLFSPITLRNYEKPQDFKEPTWVELALENRDIASRRFQKAEHARSYVDDSERPYVHLIDGGVADNLGTRAALHSLTTTDSAWSLMRMMNLEKIDKIVFIIVNAKTQPKVTWDKQQVTPNIKQVLAATVEGLQANYTFDSAVHVKEEFDQLEQASQARKDCEELLKENCPEARLPGGELHEVDYYFITVSFDVIEDEARRKYFQKLPTRFTLEEQEIDALKLVGQELLAKSEDFKKLIQDLGGTVATQPSQ